MRLDPEVSEALVEHFGEEYAQEYSNLMPEDLETTGSGQSMMPAAEYGRKTYSKADSLAEAVNRIGSELGYYRDTAVRSALQAAFQEQLEDMTLE